MEKVYRIGSFNLCNIGMGAFTNSRDLEKIAEIIKQFDVVALQEVLSEGKIFTKEDIPSSIAKRNILTYLGGEKHWGFSWASSGDESNRNEGYAFVWNKDRLDLPEIETERGGVKYKKKFLPRMITINHDDMKRRPYYARFATKGGFEIRLLCVHTYYGNSEKESKEESERIRKKELDILLKDIYPQIEDRCTEGVADNCTILLGDYNAELVTDENREWYDNLNTIRMKQMKYKNKNKLPMKMETDEDGCVCSERYGVKVKTVQYELTTLKKRYNEETDQEEFADRGYASNYDHFSYEESQICDLIQGKPRRIDAVRKYCNDDFEQYYKTVSDHIPIMLELKIN